MSRAALLTVKLLPVRGAAKAVLLALALEADDDQCLESSVGRLMLISGLGRRCVLDHLAAFASARWITRRRRRNRNSRYRLDLLAIGSGSVESDTSGSVESDTTHENNKTVTVAPADRAQGRARAAGAQREELSETESVAARAREPRGGSRPRDDDLAAMPAKGSA